MTLEKLQLMIGCIKPQYCTDNMQMEYSKFKGNFLEIVENSKSLV